MKKKLKKDPGVLLKKKKKSVEAEVETKKKKKSKVEPVETKKKKKDSKELSPLEKARLAKGSGKKAKSSKKATLPTWKAPKELKRFNFEVRFTTEKDGMPGPNFKITRYSGKIEADKDPRKMWDLSTYDPQTVVGVASRLSLTLFHATGKPSSKGVPSRLQGSTEYILHGSVGPTKDGKIKAAIAKVFLEETTKKGKVKLSELDKKDYQVRKIRKVNRYLAGAFAQVVAEAPKHERKRRKEADDE